MRRKAGVSRRRDAGVPAGRAIAVSFLALALALLLALLARRNLVDRTGEGTAPLTWREVDPAELFAVER